MERTSHTQLRPLVKNKNSQFRFFRKVLLIVLISAEILAQIVGFTLYSLYAVDIIKSRAIDALFASYPVPPYGDIGTPAWLVSFDTLKEDALDPSWGNCYRTKVGSDLPLSNGDSPNTCLYGGEYYNYGRYILLRDSHPSNFAFSSFVFEVNMAIHSGNAGGIIFLYQTPYHS